MPFSYRKSLEFNSDNVETRKLLEKLTVNNNLAVLNEKYRHIGQAVSWEFYSSSTFPLCY